MKQKLHAGPLALFLGVLNTYNLAPIPVAKLQQQRFSVLTCVQETCFPFYPISWSTKPNMHRSSCTKISFNSSNSVSPKPRLKLGFTSLKQSQNTKEKYGHNSLNDLSQPFPTIHPNLKFYSLKA